VQDALKGLPANVPVQASADMNFMDEAEQEKVGCVGSGACLLKSW